MKKILSKLLPGCLIPLSVTPFLSLSSCKEQDLQITVDKEKLVCYEHEFKLNYKANRSIPKGTRLGIIGAGSDLFIDEERTDFSKENGVLAFKINSGIHYDKQIDYTLVFSYGDKEILIEGLQVMYVFQEEDYKDEIRAVQETVTNQDDWEYTYKFQFSNAPLSSVKVDLVGGQSYDLLELTKNEIKVEKEGGLYYLTVPLHLSYSVVENNFITFDIEFSFTNSFGFTQITTINDLGCEFKFTPTDVIPDIFLDFGQSGSRHSLYGIKKNVPVSSINHFSVLSIKDVDVIEEGAFSLIDGNPDTFKSITKIKLAGDIVGIGKNVFFNFYNLEELDLSEDNNIPPWLDLSFTWNRQIFNSEAWSHKSGIVWTGVNFSDREGADAIRSNWVTHLEIAGLGASKDYTTPSDKWEHCWTPYGYDEVTPEDWFVTKNEGSVVTLTAIDTTKYTREDLRKIGVIKIPDNVTAISLNPTGRQKDFSIFKDVSCSFNPLQYYKSPFFPDVVENTFNRRLVFGKNLTEINQNISGVGAFYQIGLCGNIILPNKLTFIENNTFKDATYRYFKVEDQEFYCDYRFGFEYGSSPTLNRIGNEFLAQSLIEYCNIPSSIKKMGDSLFSECDQLTKIDFSSFLSVPSDIEASTPLSGLKVGSNRYFYINKSSSLEDWTTLITNWCGGTLPEGWSITKK